VSKISNCLVHTCAFSASNAALEEQMRHPSLLQEAVQRSISRVCHLSLKKGVSCHPTPARNGRQSPKVMTVGERRQLTWKWSMPTSIGIFPIRSCPNAPESPKLHGYSITINPPQVHHPLSHQPQVLRVIGLVKSPKELNSSHLSHSHRLVLYLID
jgi:hypothetical protein